MSEQVVELQLAVLEPFPAVAAADGALWAAGRAGLHGRAVVAEVIE